MRATFGRTRAFQGTANDATAGQAEYPRPADPWGQAFRQAIVAGQVVRNTLAQLLRAPTPRDVRDTGLFTPYPGYQDFVGAFAARVSRTDTIEQPNWPYFGVYPLGQQPVVNKPLPWLDSTRSQSP